MKLPTNFVKHFVFGAIFGGALLFGFGASKASAQTYQDRYYNDGYNNNNGYYRQDRSHQKQEKRDLKHHQRHGTGGLRQQPVAAGASASGKAPAQASPEPRTPKQQSLVPVWLLSLQLLETTPFYRTF